MPQAADLTALAGATIAFDLDGTLVDTAPDLIGTLNVLLGEEGLPALPLEEARPFIGRGARWMIGRGFEAAGAPLEPEQLKDLFNRFIAHYEAHIADTSRPFPGVETALTELKDAGAKLAVCTNKLTGLSLRLLDALDLTRHFDAVVGADAAQAQKPDPRHLIAAVTEAGGSMDTAILVGDAATDAGAARSASAGLILVSFGYTETPAADLSPDILIHSFDELPQACVRLLGACGA
ncbi:phosphoglycolate phosphatase [Phenylobacterium deserti]|uniref:Phosphoglycolate phosphatase n=1 Tax=Phenylobacterium deserti TaxID=1914756 RepID=A0A328AG35_9CAUL|nr:phosphoglycolate phosphatase [Phenylobacterium deserti]RAK52384.1 phosphoglycolate phosphatase [Phenylobacterium deserti]